MDSMEEDDPAAPGDEEEEDVDETKPNDGEEEEDEDVGPPDGAAEEAEEAAAVTAAVPADKPQYSTRGSRGGGAHHGEPAARDDPLDRLARQALAGELALSPPQPERYRTALTNSFLTDSITEEERRTRTRYIPAVDGMHALRKHQVKADLQLIAAASAAAAAATATATSKKGGSHAAEDADAAPDGAADGDDKPQGMMDVVSRGGVEWSLPSAAFALPPPATATTTTTGASDPGRVEAVTAFNPPRPPESVGAKKKHRLLRWERRPADMEVDLRNYRRTVQRTREELTRAQLELARLQTVESLLRRHFAEHLTGQRREWERLARELERVQHDCVAAAGLVRAPAAPRSQRVALKARDRAGKAPKPSAAALMRDVLALLQKRGKEIQGQGLSLQQVPTDDAMAVDEVEGGQSHGVGGIDVMNFVDWDRHTELKRTALASAWTVPGDIVQTPYGQGECVAVLGVERLDAKAPPPAALMTSKSVKDDADNMQVDEATKGGNLEGEEKVSDTTDVSTPVKFLLPRIAVRLPFGVGFFPVDSVTPKETSILTYADGRLAQRWKGIMESGLALGEIVDVVSMSGPAPVPTHPTAENGGDADDISDDSDPHLVRLTRSSMVPVGAGMFPTTAGRGAMLSKMTVDELDKEISAKIFQGVEQLGRKDNQGVTKEVREREDVHEDILRLEAEVLHLKNQLYRQRRLRIMNERTYASTQERAGRVESLVSEMRTDLKTLKRRLDEDVADLGMDETQAEAILKAYYDSLDYKHSGEASPPKRLKRVASDGDNGFTDDDEDDLQNDVFRAIEMQVEAA